MKSKRKRFWAPEFKRQETRKNHYWCPKCATWVRNRVIDHHCDAPKRNRYCPICERHVKLSVKWHKCDEPPAFITIPGDLPEKRCNSCKEMLPIHPVFFYRRGVGWEAQCKACKEEKRQARKART